MWKLADLRSLQCLELCYQKLDNAALEVLGGMSRLTELSGWTLSKPIAKLLCLTHLQQLSCLSMSLLPVKSSGTPGKDVYFTSTKVSHGVPLVPWFSALHIVFKTLASHTHYSLCIAIS